MHLFHAKHTVQVYCSGNVGTALCHCPEFHILNKSRGLCTLSQAHHNTLENLPVLLVLQLLIAQVS